MANRDQVAAEIRDLTSKLIGVGLCVDSNFPRLAIHTSDGGPVEEVSVSGLEEVSFALRNRPYKETYDVLLEKRAYNMRLIDGALVQLRYRFGNGELAKHILSFYPSPDLLEYQNDPDLYESDVLFAEVVMKDIVTTPIRFDFDRAAFQDYIHPSSHFTVGQYRNCRIPVKSALTPHRFINFVLRAFYSTPYHELCAEWSGTAPDFGVSVTPREMSDLHWSFS